MSVLAQGTQIYVLNPEESAPAVMEVEGATTFSPGTAPASQIDETTLKDLVYRQYRAGLRDPGQASIGLNADPAIASHVTLHGYSEAVPSPVLKFAIGWSDGTDDPTVGTGGDFEFPTGRTWFAFEGYISDFPFDFSQNTVVTTELSIQRTGGSQWIAKGA